MQSLILGASGIVGGHIARLLAEAGERPFGLSRNTLAGTVAGIDWIQGDLTLPMNLELPEVSTIYCTAHVGLLPGVLERLTGKAPRRVVAFTSTSIVTKADSQDVAERDFVRDWARSEQDLIETCERMGIAWTVLRPTIIYDEGRDQNVTRLARIIQKTGVFPLAGNGEGLRQPVSASDLAAGAIQAAASVDAINKIYHLPGGETLTYREMIGRIFDGLAKRRRIVTLPPFVWMVAFALAKPFLQNATAAMGSRMSKDMVFDGEPARTDFGWNPSGFHPAFADLA